MLSLTRAGISCDKDVYDFNLLGGNQSQLQMENKNSRYKIFQYNIHIYHIVRSSSISFTRQGNKT